MIYIFIAFIFMISIIFFYNNFINNTNIEIHNSKKYPISLKKCKTNILKPEIFVIKKHNLILTEKNNSDLIIPCGYNNINTKINKMIISNKKQKIYTIYNCDKIVSKNNLWEILYNKYGYSDDQIMPMTYNITKKNDISLFKKTNNNYLDESKLFLLKKNIQRKEGILLSKNIKNILSKINDDSDNYKIIQEYIPNLFLINRRKINLRYYFLIINKEGIVNTFLYKHGKCIYSNKNYDIDYRKIPDEDLMNYKEVFLTSYNLDPDIYNINPEDFDQLKLFMGVNNYNLLLKRIKDLFIKLSKAIQYEFNIKSKLYNNLCFQLFGADILFDNNLKPFLLELNKGPSMKYVTEKDKKLKENMIEDLFYKMKLLKTNSNIINDENNNNDYNFERLL